MKQTNRPVPPAPHTPAVPAALGPNPVPFGWCYSRWCELLNKLEPGDHLWEYDSPKEDWDRLMGSSGIVLLRNGVVIDTMACKMN